MPKKNVQDLDDLPQEVRDQMKFVPVDRFEDVLKVALVPAIEPVISGANSANQVH